MSDKGKLGPPDIPEVLYLCDRLACDNCGWPLCKHTTNIEHAVNFERVSLDVDAYFEKEE